MILVTPKQEMERKSEWFCGVNFFRSKFKVEWENGVWTKIGFLASGFLFTCGNFTLIFTIFWIFWIGFFFLNAFSNPFIVRSWSSFLFSQWKLELTSWNRLLGIDFFTNFYCFAVKICVRAFRPIAWLTSLKKMTSELTYGTLNFMNILVKDQ